MKPLSFILLFLTSFAPLNTIGQFSFTQSTNHGIPPLSVLKSHPIDYDNDGDLDLIIFGKEPDTSPHNYLYVNDGYGFFQIDSNISLPNHHQFSIFNTDFNQDGYEDFVLLGYDQNLNITNELFLNTTTNNFIHSNIPGIESLRVYKIFYGDLNGDNKTDLILTGNNSIHTWHTVFALNNGDGTFNLNKNSLFSRYEIRSSTLIDINSDGNLDILTYNMYYSPDSSFAYINDGLGNFTPDKSIIIHKENWPRVTAGDYNQDGAMDFYTQTGGMSGLNYTKVYLNQINNQFKESFSIALNFQHKTLIHDLNHDNLPDLVIIPTSPSIQQPTEIYEGIGNGDFYYNPRLVFNGGFVNPLKFDCDQDGDMDFLISGIQNSMAVTRLFKNDIIIGTTQIHSASQIIFPNPNNGNFRIANSTTKPLELIIYDLFGKEVYRNIYVGNSEIEINVHLEPGLYLVQSISGNQSQTDKLIIE